MAVSSRNCVVVAEGLDHPECVVIASDGSMFAGGEGGQIYHLSADGHDVSEVASVPGECGGLALDGEGNVYECNMSGNVHRITPSGAVTTYSSGTSALPAQIPNYPVFDPVGDLFWSDSGDWSTLNGRVYVARPSGRTEIAFPDYLAFPNGLALDSDEGWLYVAQSTTANVVRLRMEDGQIDGRPELYITLPAGSIPDGLALAESGNLYISCYEPTVIYVVSPESRT